MDPSLELQLATLEGNKGAVEALLNVNPYTACEIPVDKLDERTGVRIQKAIQSKPEENWKLDKIPGPDVYLTLGNWLHAKFVYRPLSGTRPSPGWDPTYFPSFGPKISLLEIAVLTNRLELVQLFLDKFEPGEAKEQVKEEEDEEADEEYRLQDYSPLVVAAWLGHEDIVKILLDSQDEGKYIGKPSDDNVGTALHAASAQGHMGIVKLLIEEADLNSDDGYYSSALGAASYWGRTDIVTYLLEHSLKWGVDVNRKRHIGPRALELAMMGVGNVETVKLLLENGVTYPDEVNLINRAHAFCTRIMINLFYRRCRDGKSGPVEFFDLLCDASSKNSKRLPMLLDQKEMLSMTEEHFHSEITPHQGCKGPLWYAVSGGHVEAAKQILEKRESFLFSGDPLLAVLDRKQDEKQLIMLNLMLGRFDPDVPRGDGETVLHEAVWCGNRAIVGALVSHGADPTRPNRGGYSPRELADELCQKQKDEIGQRKKEIKNHEKKAEQYKQISKDLRKSRQWGRAQKSRQRP